MIPILIGFVIAVGSAFMYWNMPQSKAITVPVPLVQEQPALDKKQVILARLIKQGIAVQSWGTTPSP